MAPVNYAELGFNCTVDDVAEMLSLTRAETLDLIRARDLPVLVLPSSAPHEHATFRIHPDEVRDLAERMKNNGLTTDQRVRALTQSRLREYLKATPPVEDYDEAVEFGLPLWGRASGGRRTLNVFPSGVRAYVELLDPAATMTEEAISLTLTRLGGVKVRGVIPWSTPGGKQRWATMYRVPLSLLQGEDDQAVIAEVGRSQRDQGEEFRRRPGSTPYVVGKS